MSDSGRVSGHSDDDMAEYLGMIHYFPILADSMILPPFYPLASQGCEL